MQNVRPSGSVPTSPPSHVNEIRSRHWGYATHGPEPPASRDLWSLLVSCSTDHEAFRAFAVTSTHVLSLRAPRKAAQFAAPLTMQRCITHSVHSERGDRHRSSRHARDGGAHADHEGYLLRRQVPITASRSRASRRSRVSKPSLNDEKIGSRHSRAWLRRCWLSNSRARLMAASSSNAFVP